MILKGPKSTPPSRRALRLRYSLRGLLLVITLTACALGWLTWQWRRYQGELIACDMLDQHYLHARFCTTSGIEAGAASSRPELLLAEWPQGRIYRPIQEVGLYDAVLDRRCWETLARFRYLDGLWIQDCSQAPDVEAFAQLDSLRTLVLETDTLSAASLRGIAGLPQLQRLTLIKANANDEAPEYAPVDWSEAIAPLRELQTLELQHVTVSTAGLQGIANMRQLRTLLLSTCRINNEELEALAQLNQLETLELADVVVDDQVLSAWAKLRKLKRLVLARCAISDAGLASIAELRDLEYLSLNGAAITDDGLPQLAELPHLRELKLIDTPLSRRALVTIAAMPTLNPSQVELPYHLRHVELPATAHEGNER